MYPKQTIYYLYLSFRLITLVLSELLFDPSIAEANTITISIPKIISVTVCSFPGFLLIFHFKALCEWQLRHHHHQQQKRYRRGKGDGSATSPQFHHGFISSLSSFRSHFSGQTAFFSLLSSYPFSFGC